METRLLIAYFLIGLLLAAASLLLRRVMIRGRKHRRLMRGHRPLKDAARR
jgi:hypothetical protein